MTPEELKTIIAHLAAFAEKASRVEGVVAASKDDVSFGVTVRLGGDHYFAARASGETAIGDTPQQALDRLAFSMKYRVARVREQAKSLGFDLKPTGS